MENPLIVLIAVVTGAVVGWLACRARAEKMFDADRYAREVADLLRKVDGAQ